MQGRVGTASGRYAPSMRYWIRPAPGRVPYLAAAAAGLLVATAAQAKFDREAVQGDWIALWETTEGNRLSGDATISVSKASGIATVTFSLNGTPFGQACGQVVDGEREVEARPLGGRHHTAGYAVVSGGAVWRRCPARSP